ALDGGQQLGPSGAVSDQLGGRQLLAHDSIPTYRPTLGDRGAFNSSSLVPSSPAAPSGGSADIGSAIKGLKAKQLSLKTPTSLAKPSVPQHHAVMDHVAHQTKAGAHAVAKAGNVADHTAVAKASNVADHTAHQVINKVGTHKPHIAEHKVA